MIDPRIFLVPVMGLLSMALCCWVLVVVEIARLKPMKQRIDYGLSVDPAEYEFSIRWVRRYKLARNIFWTLGFGFLVAAYGSWILI